MIDTNQTYIIMGLLDPDSIAYAVGRTIQALGGKVIFTVQNERMKRLFLDRSKKLTDAEKSSLDIRYCDITIEDEIGQLFATLGPIGGLVHSIAFVNPKTGLGENFHTDAIEDLKLGFHISSISLASITRHAYKNMPDGGSIVALTFDSRLAYPYYNWMGVNKAALEAVVRGLARQHGRDLIRVNAVSAGPLATRAATSIPGFDILGKTWSKKSPITWDIYEDKQAVANAVVFLLGPYAKKITGQTIHVDGGASITGGDLLEHEQRTPAIAD